MTMRYESFPFPLARPCHIAFGHAPDATLQGRVWAIAFAAYQALRTASLPVLEAYLDAPLPTAEMPQQKSVAAIAKAVERLQCPYFGDWVTTLESLAKHVRPDRVGLESVLPLALAVQKMEARPWTPLDESYGLRGTGALPAHRALMGMRNGIAHGGNLPDASACDRLLEHYLPVLEHLLDAVAFLAECDLRVRDGEFDDRYTRVRVLRGPGEPEVRELGLDEAWIDALSDHPVAMGLPDGSVLPMSPLFAAGAASPVGLYDGHYILHAKAGGRGDALVQQRHVYYLGAGHDRWPDPSAVDDLLERLENRRVQWRVSKANLAPWTIADTLHFGTESTLGDLRGRKYFPDCHVDRADLDAEWARFLTAADPAPGAPWPPSGDGLARKSGVVLAGAAGAGKTAWACRVVERLLAEGANAGAGEARSREGRNLVLFLRGDMIPARDGREDRLLATLLERMGLRDGDFASFDDLLAHLDRTMRDDRVPGRRLVIVLDAMNEVMVAPENCFRESLDLIRSAARHPWVKVVVTIRQEFLGVLHAKAGGQEKNIFFGSEPCLHVMEHGGSQVDGRRSPVIDLRPLSDGEAAEAYARYQRNGLVDRPGCRTPWAVLDKPTRQLLRNPLLLYVFHLHFGGREAGVVRGRADLFRTYVEGLVAEYEGLEDACRQVVGCLEAQGVTELTAADGDRLRLQWAQGITPDEARLGMSPVETLLHAGLLRARSSHEGAGFVFVFESVLEYLLFDAWRSRTQGLDLAFLQDIVSRGQEGAWPETFWNAFGFVFERLLIEERWEDWPALVHERSPASLDSVAHRTWLAAAAGCGLPSDAGHAALGITPPGRVLDAFMLSGRSGAVGLLLEMGNLASQTRLPEWSELATVSAMEVLEPLVAQGRREFENDLASVYNNLGNALSDRGDLDGAIDAYGKAREIRERLVSGGRREFENDLAMVYNNLGVSLRARGDLDGAIDAYGKVREIRERLVSGGRRELENELAILYNNLGVALRARGDLDAAIVAYGKAREIRERLVAGGRRELENELAMVYNNLGVALRARGDLDGAIDAYERTREIRERLVAGGRRELENDLAGVYNNLGLALEARGDLDGAIDAYGKAREIRERLVSGGRRELENDLAMVYNNLGGALRVRGDLDGAIDAYEKTREIRERLVSGGRRELENDLAGVYNNLGLALRARGDLDGAIDAHQKAREVQIRLISGGRRELENDLASVYNNLGNALSDRGDLDGAIDAYGKAREIRERLVSGGRRELENDLASVYNNLGVSLRSRGDLDGAIDAYGKVRVIRERLVTGGRRELENDLASVYSNLGNALKARGDLDGAIDAYGKAREIRERLVSGGRRELENDLAAVYNNLGNALRARGDLDGAIDAYGKAREIRERLVSSGRWQALPTLCMTLYNQLLTLRDREDEPGQGEVAATVDNLGRLVREHLEVGMLPAPWKSELLDVARLALKTQNLPGALRDSLALLVRDLD